MKKTIGMLAALSCSALLAFGSFPAGWSASTAQASATQDGVTTVNEVEPNDDLPSATPFDFPAPGETIVLQGSATPDDPGFFSEELETRFTSGFGAIQDVFIADPDALEGQPWGDGPIPVRVTLNWDNDEADVDLLIGTTVDDSLFFFDGFKVLELDSISLAKPESFPQGGSASESAVLYLQPQGIMRGDPPEPVANDGFGRELVFSIKDFGPGDVNYQITIQTGTVEASGAVAKQEAPFGSEQHQVDDNGVSFFGFTGFDNSLIVNCFRPSRYPATLTSIEHPFVAFRDLPDPTGSQIRMVVFTGEEGEGLVAPPSNPTFLVDQMVTIPGTIEFVNERTTIPVDPPVTIESGVVYVGFEFPEGEATGIIPVFSRNAYQAFRSWFSDDGGTTWTPPASREDLADELVGLNWYGRANFEFGKSIASAAKRKTKLKEGRSASDIPLLKRASGLKAISR